MTTNERVEVLPSEADRALWKRLLSLPDENKAHRAAGRPVVDGLELIARHRLSSQSLPVETPPALERAMRAAVISSTDEVAVLPVEVREALEWYAEKGEALRRNPVKDKPEFSVAVLAEIELDGGTRGRQALASTQPPRDEETKS